MSNDLTELRKIAEAAPEGVRAVDHDDQVIRLGDGEIIYDRSCESRSEWAADRNRGFTAAFDPPTVLELIARVKSSEAKVAAGLDVAEWIRGNHGDCISREIEERLRDALEGTA